MLQLLKVLSSPPYQKKKKNLLNKKTWELKKTHKQSLKTRKNKKILGRGKK